MTKEPPNTQENYIKRKEWAIEILEYMKEFLHTTNYTENEIQIYSHALDIAIRELVISVENQ